MMVAIDSHNRVAIAGSEMFKMAVLKRVVQVKALVVWLVVSVPVIVVHVLRPVHFAVGAMLGLRLRVRLALRRRSGYVSLIGARGIRTVGLGPTPLFVLPLVGMTLMRTLSRCRECDNQNECQGKAETCPHSFLLEGPDTFLPNRHGC